MGSIKAATPSKAFQFVAEIDGVDQFEIQKLTPPEITVETAEHGVGVTTVKTAGLLKVSGTAKLEKLRIAGTGSSWIWNWLRQVVDTETDTTGLFTGYGRVIIIKEYAGGVVIGKWRWEGCFPVKITQSDKDRTSSDNAIETIELNVNKVVKLS